MELEPYDNRFNEIDKPEGPPYVLDRPGALSFNIGKLRFRQNVYDRNRNLQPLVFRPGRLSFKIGPIRFRQIPTQTFRFSYFPCCVDPFANCEQYVDCEEERNKI